MEAEKQILGIFSRSLRQIFLLLPVDLERMQEIRLRAGRPLLAVIDNKEYFLMERGEIAESRKFRGQGAYIVTESDIQDTMEYLSRHSLYAFEDEIRQGFLTIQGGHRIGIAGKAVMDGGRIRTIRHISFLNIRLAHEKKGCADRVMPFLYENGQVCHTLILSPPRCGKTTLLRDIIRQLSDGFPEREGVTVAVVDERSEIGACFQGVPQNDLGARTDILDCCPKAQGMMMMIRTMSPQVVAVDEIGSREELEAVEYAMNCGCKLVATVHGSSIEELRRKPVLRQMLEENIFERFLVLGGGMAGRIQGIFDGEGRKLVSCF